ncbi:MAG: hypothetical protein NC400_15265, partial [Clostridium sp.]|nr:hypothetical protein [Clostridium sp.]
LAGIAAGSILLISPWIVNTVFEIGPENYYMLHWAAVLAVLGCFQSRAKDKGLNNWNKLCLLAMGFYLGAVCIWNGIGFYLPLWLLCAAAGGIFCQWIFRLAQKKRTVLSGGEKAAGIIKEGKEMTAEEKPDTYFIAEDGRKIKYIENPLPGPKKHVKREMDFDITEFDDLQDIKDGQDEFDVEIDENDDFDW